MAPTDKFICPDITTLLKWMLSDLDEKGEIFGVPEGLFFTPRPSDPFRMERYGQRLETPLGAAAGPHTQMAQNIVTAWLCGARYIELKTVQTLDDLTVTKPCIDMTDEGYNCEWSQELTLDQSFNEYLNAFILIFILKDRLGWGAAEYPGFIFNMSAGYNLDGIRSENVQRFFARMADCSGERDAKVDSIAGIYPRVRDLAIPERISDSITISTMHGCPPEEIEKIGRYFIGERGLHTTIKMNPTLLGAAPLRHILNRRLGYKIEVPDEAFGHDLTFDDGVALIDALQKAARDRRVSFGLKLTNTLETANSSRALPEKETMVYMSGRALHPISIHLAARLQETFKGTLDLSFSAGVDCFNIIDTLACGLRPVTVCSDLLKPGGYGRLSQYLECIAGQMRLTGEDSLEELVLRRAGIANRPEAIRANLKAYADESLRGGRYEKRCFPFEDIKTARDLPRIDCAAAPCMTACSAAQDIPRYLDFTARGQFGNAFKTILATNPFPHVQGMVCDHLCQDKCTRINYDKPLMIREIKRFIAQNHGSEPSPASVSKNGLKVAVIGAGPTGLSCAWFLLLGGFEVDIYETKTFAGGMAADGIPAFRLDDGSLSQDIDTIIALGARLHTGLRIDEKAFRKLRLSHDWIYIAVGAQESIELGLPGDDADGVMDQLRFLSAVRQGSPPDLGRSVVVVGGGNAAMDVARTAKRLVGEQGTVTIVYRRTREEMPADPEEVAAAIAEGVILRELTQPECMLVENGRVASNVCFRMSLGEKDASGRPRPIRIEGSEFEMHADTVITAIGQRAVLDFLPGGSLTVDNESLETPLDGVLAGGDAIRGASSLVNAIADGRRAAETIMKKSEQTYRIGMTPIESRRHNLDDLRVRQARRVPGPETPAFGGDRPLDFELCIDTMTETAARAEASRCLQCDQVCNVCVTVCPNRANVALRTTPVSYPRQRVVKKGATVVVDTFGRASMGQPFQIVNIADFCNECGNCATFCPTSGAPYRDKFRMHLTRAGFDGHDEGYLLAAPDRLYAKLDGLSAILTRSDDRFIYEDSEARVVLFADTLEAAAVELKEGTRSKDLGRVVETALLYTLVAGRPPFV